NSPISLQNNAVRGCAEGRGVEPGIRATVGVIALDERPTDARRAVERKAYHDDLTVDLQSDTPRGIIRGDYFAPSPKVGIQAAVDVETSDDGGSSRDAVGLQHVSYDDNLVIGLDDDAGRRPGYAGHRAAAPECRVQDTAHGVACHAEEQISGAALMP